MDSILKWPCNNSIVLSRLGITWYITIRPLLRTGWVWAESPGFRSAEDPKLVRKCHKYVVFCVSYCCTHRWPLKPNGSVEFSVWKFTCASMRVVLCSIPLRVEHIFSFNLPFRATKTPKLDPVKPLRHGKISLCMVELVQIKEDSDHEKEFPQSGAVLLLSQEGPRWQGDTGAPIYLVQRGPS